MANSLPITTVKCSEGLLGRHADVSVVAMNWLETLPRLLLEELLASCAHLFVP